MACRGDEVDAAVHPGVRDPLLAVDVDLLLQVGFVLVIDELHDGLPAGGKAGIENKQQQLTVIEYCGVGGEGGGGGSNGAGRLDRGSRPPGRTSPLHCLVGFHEFLQSSACSNNHRSKRATSAYQFSLLI